VSEDIKKKHCLCMILSIPEDNNKKSECDSFKKFDLDNLTSSDFPPELSVSISSPPPPPSSHLFTFLLNPPKLSLLSLALCLCLSVPGLSVCHSVTQFLFALPLSFVSVSHHCLLSHLSDGCLGFFFGCLVKDGRHLIKLWRG